MLQLIQQGVLFLGTLLGGITDAKTGYIYDKITYPMIAIGAILSFVQLQWFNIGLAVGIFILMYIGYRFGKIGGGDVKIFTGIALLNPYNNLEFVLAIALFAAIGAMLFYSVFYSLKYLRKGFVLKDNKEGIRSAGVLGIAVIIYFFVLVQNGFFNEMILYIIGVPFAAGIVFIALQKGIKKEFFEKKISLKEYEEDEIIVEERNTKKVLDIMKGKQLVGEKELSQMKKNGIKHIWVLRDLPRFGPFIFIGVIMAMLMPNIFSLLF